MNSHKIRAFPTLLKREMWESKNLFIASPAVLTVLIIVAFFWTLLQVPEDIIVETLGQLKALTDGVDITTLAPVLMPIAIPYIIVLSFCTLIYLINALYQDRKDSSILFWQSMPVSNFHTVLSKVITVCFVAPLFVVAAISVLFLMLILIVSVLGASHQVVPMGMGQLILASIYSLLLVYMTAVLASLWLLPTVGWLLLFSAFAKNLPFLWAMGAFILLLFVEDFIFGTQFLGNWLESRTTNYNYIIFDVSDFFKRLFSYDMLFGLVLGAVLIAGAVFMRRFAD